MLAIPDSYYCDALRSSIHKILDMIKVAIYNAPVPSMRQTGLTLRFAEFILYEITVSLCHFSAFYYCPRRMCRRMWLRLPRFLCDTIASTTASHFQNNFSSSLRGSQIHFECQQLSECNGREEFVKL